MELSTAAILGGVIGAVVVACTVLAWRLSERDQSRTSTIPEPVVPPGVSGVLAVIRSSALVVDPSDEVLKASAPAHMLGIVDGSRVAVPELLSLVWQVRRDGQIREADLVVRSGRSQETYVTARVAPLGSRLILVLVDDRTHEHRVEAIRRDFVANVSHELKTPVGALNLLAEAVAEAADDPEAVQRFSSRMHHETERLTRLVQQIIELSRLQGDDPLDNAKRIAIDSLVERAIDRVKVDAADKSVTVEFAGELGLEVMGDPDQLGAALGNLVENSVAYSEAGQRVLVNARAVSGMVELAVTDHGAGIPSDDIDRIFERFYRVDPARARTTGGTGLGLSIVKHVTATHGGDVRVWSVEGEGSTFTIVLPAPPLRTTLAEPTPSDPAGMSIAPVPDSPSATGLNFEAVHPQEIT